jgi:hypothetical protein
MNVFGTRINAPNGDRREFDGQDEVLATAANHLPHAHQALAWLQSKGLRKVSDLREYFRPAQAFLRWAVPIVV